MSKYAIISDIHANLEALQAVLSHIDRQGDVEKIYCLGDVVGYGPDPTQVIDIVMDRCEWTLMGNHDFAILNAPVGFNFIAAGAIKCQRLVLDPDEEAPEAGLYSKPRRETRWQWLQNLPESKIVGESLFVHASPRDPIVEYILPTDTEEKPEKMAEIFSKMPERCYIGHTHLPGVFTDEPAAYPPIAFGSEWRFQPGGKVIVNVGSVGQPRDQDPRACYVTVTDASVQWHRVEYDIEAVVRKCVNNPGLDDRCGLRLRLGK